MADQERAAKRRRFSSNIITLKVGTPPETLTTHEDHISEKSSFFRAALQRHWQEGKTGIVELPDDDADTVATYLDWLYGGKVAKLQVPTETMTYDHLAKLYVFGEKIQDDAFCDAAIVAMMLQVDQPDPCGQGYFNYNASVYHVIYAGTPKGSPIRQYLVEIAMDVGGEDWSDWLDREEPLPPEFLQELVCAIWRRQEVKDHESHYARRAKWLKQKV